MFRPTLNTGGAITISDSHVFADTSARDTYFASHFSELVDNLYIYITDTTSLQQYKTATSSWIDMTPALKGQDGAPGADGTSITVSVQADAPTSPSSGDIWVDTDDSLFNTADDSVLWNGVARPTLAGNALKVLRANSDGNALEFATVENGDSTWGGITGTLADQTDLTNALDGKATKTASDLTLYVYEDATGTGDGSSKANGFTTLQAAIDAIPDVAQNVTVIVSKGSTNYLGDTTTIQKASVKSLTIRGEFYAYEACDANAVAGKVVDASADFSNFAVGDRVVCTKYSGTVGASSIEDYFYATVTEIGTGYIQTSEATKVPTSGWTYLINQTVFDGDEVANQSIIINFADKLNIYGIGFDNQAGINSYGIYYISGNGTILNCIFYDQYVAIASVSEWIITSNSAILNSKNSSSLIVSSYSGFLYVSNVVFSGGSFASSTAFSQSNTTSKILVKYSGFFKLSHAFLSLYPITQMHAISCYIASTCTYGAYGYNITLVSCTNNAATPVYNLTSGGSIEEWDGQALPSIADATGGQVLALKSDKSALEFTTVDLDTLGAALTSLSGLTSDANKLPYYSGVDTFDVCDFGSLGRSLVGCTTESAIRTLIKSVYSTTANMTVYVDSAATGTGDGTSWTDAFTTIKAAHYSLPLIIAHTVVILVRDGTYTDNLMVSRQCLPTGSIEIRAEYYWYGTVAATKTGKITLGASDFGYAERVQIEAGDRVIVFKWSGTNEASVPTTTYEDTVASVSGAEVTLTTNSGVSFTSACTYAIIKNTITVSSGSAIGLGVAGTITISGFKIGGTILIGVHVRNQFTNCTINACDIYGFTSCGVYAQVPSTIVKRSLIRSSETSASGLITSGNISALRTSNGVRINMTGGSSNGGYCLNGDISFEWTHIAAAAVGMRAVRAGTFSNSATSFCLNEGTTPRSPASSTDPAYIL